MPETDLAVRAHELYGLPSGGFTAARNTMAARLRSDGDAELAAAVRALPKPALAAWVVNTMVREMPDRVEELLDLGELLRNAQADLDGPALRTLTTQRRALTAAVAREGVALAADRGQPVSPTVVTQVESTLHAAMTDAGAADALRTGLLVEPMAATGLGPADLTGVLAVPLDGGAEPTGSGRPLLDAGGGPTDTDVPAGRGELDAVAERRRAAEAAEREAARAALEEAEADLAEAEGAAARAREKLLKRQEKLKAAQARALQLRAEIDELRRSIDAKEHELGPVEDALTSAERKHEEARTVHDAARADAQEARRQVASLRTGP